MSPNFLVCKFCGKAQFLYSFGRFARNYAETVDFHKSVHTRKLGDITVFFAVLDAGSPKKKSLCHSWIILCQVFMINIFLNCSGRFFFRLQIRNNVAGNGKLIQYLNRKYKMDIAHSENYVWIYNNVDLGIWVLLDCSNKMYYMYKI